MATVVDHPLTQAAVTELRRRDTTRAAFRHILARVAHDVVYEALRDLPTGYVEVTTPLGTAAGTQVVDPPLFAPVLRAGLGMLDAALALVPSAPVGFIGLRRDEETLRPVAYLDTVPADLEGRPVVVLDPMLATGGSLLHAARLLAACNAGPLRAACIIAAPEGVDLVESSEVDIAVTTAAIDPGLNDQAFIVPGLGDAGDRQFDL